RIVRPRDGRIAWLEERGTTMRDPRTGKVRVTGLVWDVTDRKRGELELRDSEARFRAVADVVPDLLWQNDRNGSAVWCNQRWLAYTGQTPEQAQGRGWLDVIHPNDREQSRAKFQHAFQSGEPLRQEHRMRRGTNGEYRWFLV